MNKFNDIRVNKELIIEKLKNSFSDNIDNLSKRFANHVVNYEEIPIGDDYIIMCSYKNRDSNVDAMEFIIKNGVLIVLGDLYNSIYEWTCNNKIGFFKDLGLGYFCDKFTCLDNYYAIYEYSAELAEKEFKELVEEYKQYKIDDNKAIDLEQLEDEISLIDFGDEYSFIASCREFDGNNVLDINNDDGQLTTCGRIVNPLCRFHHFGISVVATTISNLRI